MFETVTVTAVEVVVFPAASRATAVSVWLALVAVVVSHVTVYGAVVTSAPRFAPSSLNCTPATPTLSLALAVTEMLPVTVVPGAGAVTDTVGAVLSFDAVTTTAVEVVLLPARSRAIAVSVCVPFVAPLLAQVTE